MIMLCWEQCPVLQSGWWQMGSYVIVIHAEIIAFLCKYALVHQHTGGLPHCQLHQQQTVQVLHHTTPEHGAQ